MAKTKKTEKDLPSPSYQLWSTAYWEMNRGKTKVRSLGGKVSKF